MQAAIGGFQPADSNKVTVHLRLLSGTGQTLQRSVPATSERLMITPTKAMKEMSGSDAKLNQQNWDAVRDLKNGTSVTLDGGLWEM